MATITNETKFALIAKDLEFIKAEILDIRQNIQGHFVTREEFEPIRKGFYGIIAIIVTAVVGALLGLVILR